MFKTIKLNWNGKICVCVRALDERYTFQGHFKNKNNVNSKNHNSNYEWTALSLYLELQKHTMHIAFQYKCQIYLGVPNTHVHWIVFRFLLYYWTDNSFRFKVFFFFHFLYLFERCILLKICLSNAIVLAGCKIEVLLKNQKFRKYCCALSSDAISSFFFVCNWFANHQIIVKV